MTQGEVKVIRPDPISVKVPEAVRLTGLSRSRIYELMKRGDVQYAKVGSSTLILVESLRAFIHDHRSPGPAAASSRGLPRDRRNSGG